MPERWEDHVRPHGPLVQLAPDLWQVTGRLTPLDRNMVVWRLASGGLWLHSVIALDGAGMDALDALGPVEAIVVPNGLHRMDCAVYAERSPHARVLAPAAARDRVHRKVRIHNTCEAVAAGLGFTVHVPRGVRPGELCYELPIGGGRALVVADLLFNVLQPPAGVSGWVLQHVTDSIGPLHLSRVFRWMFLQDPGAYASWVASLATIPDVKFLCVGHGETVSGDVSAALRAAAERMR